MSLSKVVLSGTVASEPQKRFTSNENVPVVNFQLAIPAAPNPRNPGIEGNPAQVKVTCWRQLAEQVAENVLTGQAVIVEGKLQINTFQSEEGVQKKYFEIEAVSVAVLPGLPQVLTGISAGNSANSAGGVNAGSRPAPALMASAAAAAPSAGYASSPSAAPAGAPTGHSDFSSADLLTEDDIPF